MANKYTKRSTARDREDRVDRTYNRSGKYKKKSSASQKWKNIIAICVAILLILGVTAFVLYTIDKNENQQITDGTYIAGIDISDMTKEQALSALKVGEEKLLSLNMKVTVLDHSVEITPKDSEVNFDWEAAIESAYESEVNQTEFNAASYLIINETNVRDRLSELGNIYKSTLKESAYTVEDHSDGETRSSTLTIEKGIPQYELDMEKLYSQVIEAYCNGVFEVTGSCIVTKPADIDFQAIFDEYCTAAKDAIIDTDKVLIIEPSEAGYGFDVNAAKDALSNAAYGEAITIPFKVLDPVVTEADLEAYYYQDVLGHYTTTASSREGRNTNLKVACEAINGLILRPGETFSYNGTLGERTEDKGYKPGPSYAGNDTVYSVGGGICQVSSTLYYCTLMAELQIDTRDEHQFYPGYIPFGMDAMVNWDNYDFKFTNNMDYPIRIDASAEGGSVTISIMGTDHRDYDVKMKYVILSTNNYDTVYRVMPEDNEKGYKDGDVIVTGYTGYTVKSYRCHYEKGTDKLISEDYIASSKYATRDKVVCKIEVPQEEETPSEGDTPSEEDTPPVTEDPNPGIIGGVTEDGGALPED